MVSIATFTIVLSSRDGTAPSSRMTMSLTSERSSFPVLMRSKLHCAVHICKPDRAIMYTDQGTLVRRGGPGGQRYRGAAEIRPGQPATRPAQAQIRAVPAGWRLGAQAGRD